MENIRERRKTLKPGIPHTSSASNGVTIPFDRL
jgi:hypothetical protein